MVRYLHTLNDIVWMRRQESHLLIPATKKLPHSCSYSATSWGEEACSRHFGTRLGFWYSSPGLALGAGFLREDDMWPENGLQNPRGPWSCGCEDRINIRSAGFCPGKCWWHVVWESWFGKALFHDSQGTFNGGRLKSAKYVLWQWNLQPKSSGGKGLIAENAWKTRIEQLLYCMPIFRYEYLVILSRHFRGLQQVVGFPTCLLIFQSYFCSVFFRRVNS